MNRYIRCNQYLDVLDNMRSNVNINKIFELFSHSNVSFLNSDSFTMAMILKSFCKYNKHRRKCFIFLLISKFQEIPYFQLSHLLLFSTKEYGEKHSKQLYSLIYDKQECTREKCVFKLCTIVSAPDLICVQIIIYWSLFYQCNRMNLSSESNFEIKATAGKHFMKPFIDFNRFYIVIINPKPQCIYLNKN